MYLWVSPTLGDCLLSLSKIEMFISLWPIIQCLCIIYVCFCIFAAQAPPSCTHKPLQECHARGTAVYEVAFHGDWITPLPPMGASFSPLVGMSHSACASLWSPYEYSTLGVQAVAENGTTATVRNEIMSFGRNTFSVFESALLDQIEIGTVVTNVTVDAFRPLVSAVSKVTPSPDWFTGVYDILLCDDDEWPAIISVNMLLWDAGSDSGVNYTSVNNASDPRQFIEQLTPQSNRSVVFSPNSVNAATPVPVGRLSFRRVAVYEDQIAENPNCHTCGKPAFCVLSPKFFHVSHMHVHTHAHTHAQTYSRPHAHPHQATLSTLSSR